MIQYEAVSAAVIAIGGAATAWKSTMKSAKRDDWTVATQDLRDELKSVKSEHQSLLTYVVRIYGWAKLVGDDSPAGAPPEPPSELGLNRP